MTDIQDTCTHIYYICTFVNIYIITYVCICIHTYIQDGELNVITCVSTIYECMYNKCGDSDVEHNAMDTLVYKELNIPTASSQKIH